MSVGRWVSATVSQPASQSVSQPHWKVVAGRVASTYTSKSTCNCIFPNMELSTYYITLIGGGGKIQPPPPPSHTHVRQPHKYLQAYTGPPPPCMCSFHSKQ